MITFTPRTLVNGSMLRNFIDQHVSIHVNVQTEVDRGASVIKATTSDDLDVEIQLSEPLNSPVKGWIEVIGVPTSANTIQNKEIIIFPDEPDNEPYNKSAHVQMVTFWNNCKDILNLE
ncbi:replication protein A 14 kDa subunit A [Contarinia nasturtii]|uniref:replication protein A 14 kDa subunit A n=1 Tax=Contarinia nasturtii TaxID=265458 RepID=UPI0012D4B650|nr:replication protein A 14 kDa subunit A [Contarinia nasturtii]